MKKIQIFSIFALFWTTCLNSLTLVNDLKEEAYFFISIQHHSSNNPRHYRVQEQPLAAGATASVKLGGKDDLIALFYEDMLQDGMQKKEELWLHISANSVQTNYTQPCRELASANWVLRLTNDATVSIRLVDRNWIGITKGGYARCRDEAEFRTLQQTATSQHTVEDRIIERFEGPCDGISLRERMLAIARDSEG